jgi:hypothetical protein
MALFTRRERLEETVSLVCDSSERASTVNCWTKDKQKYPIDFSLYLRYLIIEFVIECD